MIPIVDASGAEARSLRFIGHRLHAVALVLLLAWALAAPVLDDPENATGATGRPAGRC